MRNSTRSTLASSHDFAKVPFIGCPRSVFNRSHGCKTTFNAGQIIPFYVDEALPGDTFKCKTSVVARLATALFPIMDNLFMDVHFWAVPNRLLWENWTGFMGESGTAGDTLPSSYLVPTVTCPEAGFAALSLFDYMALPTNIFLSTVNAMFLRAYNLIYNQWYRDENIQSAVPQNIGDGPDLATDYVILPRGKRKDYFTSALPFPQKGPAVTLPLGTTAPVQLNTALTSANSGFVRTNAWNGSSPPPTVGTGTLNTTASGQFQAIASGGVPVNLAVYDPNNTLVANLESATAATINQLRESFAVQRYYEKAARGGTRYTEVIKVHFNVDSPDARLQRAEYLGGGTVPIVFHAVPQTGGVTSAPGVTTTPQATLAAYATAQMNGIGFTRSFTEHMTLLGFVSVRADLNYQQGVNKMWLRQTLFDYYWGVFAHLGEVPIQNQEIYASGDSAIDTATFGYQEIWADYRYKPGVITGAFRSNFPQTLDSWHLAQNFTALPTLSPSFIIENPPVSRIIAVPTAPQVLFDSYVALHCARPMPTWSVPGLIDHF